MSELIQVIAISGTVGVGKTSVLGELHDILSAAKISHGCIERDTLGYSYPEFGRFNERMIEQNLNCVVKNFLSSAIHRFIIAGVIESRSDLEIYERTIPNAQIKVCRLTADLEFRKQRLRDREKGAGLEWHLNRTEELDRIMENADFEDFRVDNGSRRLREVALDVLDQAGWTFNVLSA